MSPYDPDLLVLREAMEALAEKMAATEGDPICELFGTGGQGTLSHTLVAGAIADLRVKAGLNEPPLPPGTWTEALRRLNEARAKGLSGDALLAESERQRDQP